MSNQEKANYLVSLGLEILSQEEDQISFLHDYDFDYEHQISFEDFEIGDSLKTIKNKSSVYSPCCGELLDRDIMLCRRCLEFC